MLTNIKKKNGQTLVQAVKESLSDVENELNKLFDEKLKRKIDRLTEI